jgi:branched-chain amino acid transport system permease protein
MDLFGAPSQFVFAQMLIGLINGSFYAVLCLGLSIIFGILRIANFSHGAMYMMGAFGAWMLLNYVGLPFAAAVVIVPVVIGAFGVLIERTLLRHVYDKEHLNGLLLTFGVALMIEAVFRYAYGSAGLPYPNPLPGAQNLGFMMMPNYRGAAVFVSIAICVAVWWGVERTRLGSYLRATAQRPDLVRAFGVNVPLLVTLTYGFGVALAALAGVLAAPIYSVQPLMGSHLLIVVFAVVVIGGMGSTGGAIVTSFGLGLIEALTKVYYPKGAVVVIYVIMIAVLLVRPSGLFGKDNA